MVGGFVIFGFEGMFFTCAFTGRIAGGDVAFPVLRQAKQNQSPGEFVH